jgi:hypothetical protein
MRIRRTLCLLLASFVVGLSAVVVLYHAMATAIGRSFGRLGEPLGQCLAQAMDLLLVLVVALEPLTIEPDPAQLETFELSSDDGSSYGEHIIGTWEAVGYEGRTWTAIEGLAEKCNVDMNVNQRVTFDENGEVTWVSRMEFNGEKRMETDRGTYHVDRNRLVIKRPDGEQDVALIKFMDGALIVQDMQMDLRLVFKRAPPEVERN